MTLSDYSNIEAQIRTAREIRAEKERQARHWKASESSPGWQNLQSLCEAGNASGALEGKIDSWKARLRY
jgi:hypothetical protein